MAIGLMEERPPFVTFEWREIEDRNASIEAGRYMAKSVAFAIIMPAGTRDTLHREAEEWLRDINARARQEPPAFNPKWATQLDEKYRNWLRGEEVPTDGTPIKTWPVLSPAQAKNLLGARIYTVEDLAQANEDTLRAAGMGSRELKEKAKAWLEEASGPGKLVAKVAAQDVELQALRAKTREQEEALRAMQAQMALLIEKPRRGRPPNELRE